MNINMLCHPLCSLLMMLALSFTSCNQPDSNPFASPAEASYSPLVAQDSLTLTNAQWKVDSMDGFILKQHFFTNNELFGANEFIAFVELPPDSPLKVAFCYEPKRTQTSVQARKHQAEVAINGSYFDMKRHNPICYLRIKGRECGINTPMTGENVDTVNRKYYQYGSMLLRDGRPHVFCTDSNRFWERTLPDNDIMTAGPLLVLHCDTMPYRYDKDFCTQRHNRTAIGVRPDGTVILLVVEGRAKESYGMTIPEIGCTMKWLGCQEALNLDGGGSTTLWVKGNIINYPSDNGKFDHAGERTVSNCVMLVR